MFKPRLKRPYLSFLWCFPALFVLGHDIFIWAKVGSGFYFSEVGYLLQHYTPYEDAVVHGLDSEIYREFLRVILNAKAILVTGIPAALALFWINRPREKKVLKHRYR